MVGIYERRCRVKKPKFSKVLIAFIIALNIIFTTAVLIVFYHTSNEPTALVGAWFGFTTVELWTLAGIKKKKIEKENDYE
jgi:Na+(H+)/acetate symporter ActP